MSWAAIPNISTTQMKETQSKKECTGNRPHGSIHMRESGRKFSSEFPSSQGTKNRKCLKFSDVTDREQITFTSESQFTQLCSLTVISPKSTLRRPHMVYKLMCSGASSLQDVQLKSSLESCLILILIRPNLKPTELSVQFSHSVVSDYLRPHGLQHAGLPCPSPTPGGYSNSCPLHQGCHPTISSSVIPFSSHLNLSQH